MTKHQKVRGIKVRGNALHFEYADAYGDIQRGPSGFLVGQEQAAADALAIIRRGEMAKRALLQKMKASAGGVKDLPRDEGVTIAMFWDAWVNDRLAKATKKKQAKENTWQGRDWIKPMVGAKKLIDFKPDPDAENFVEELKAMKDETDAPRHAPRTIRNLFYSLHAMFEAAHIAGFVPGNPCVLEEGVLPPPKDKNPTWRRTARFDLEEVEQLISPGAIELRHCVVNGLLFLAGLRPQEASALTMRDVDSTWKPLGLIDVNKAWCSKEHRVKGLKAPTPEEEKPRIIPIHPTLAALLAQWKLRGWEEYMGRKPGANDLLVPATSKGGHLSNKRIRLWVLADLEALQFRHRRAYDTRRTFISMCTESEIPRDIFKWWTHGPDERITDLYTTIDWKAHCRQMLKLEVSLREREVAKVASISERKLHSQLHRRTESSSKLPEAQTISASAKTRSTGLEPEPTTQSELTRDNNSPETLGAEGAANHLSPRETQSDVQLCSFHGECEAASAESIGLALADTLGRWKQAANPDELRKDLTSILVALGAP